MEPKVTIMRLKVDLQCRKCYRKVKKVLSKYPQIRDQVYDEKNDIVTIRVVCCSPEKVRDDLCCQMGGRIKSIEIVEPSKPKPAPEKPKEPEKKPEPENKPKPQPTAPSVTAPPISVRSYPSPLVPAGPFYGVGPYGPQNVYGRPIYDSYGWSGPCYGGHQHYYLIEEEPSVCTIS